MHNHKSVKTEAVKYFSEYAFHTLSYGSTISAGLMLGSRLGVCYFRKQEGCRVETPVSLPFFSSAKPKYLAMFSSEKHGIAEKHSVSGQCRIQVFRDTWLVRSELPAEYES